MKIFPINRNCISYAIDLTWPTSNNILYVSSLARFNVDCHNDIHKVLITCFVNIMLILNNQFLVKKKKVLKFL